MIASNLYSSAEQMIDQGVHARVTSRSGTVHP